MVTDRWLESTYPVELSYQQAEQGLWHVRFDKLFLGRWDDKPEPKRATLPISQRKEHALSRGNPYRANAAVRQILESIRRSAKKLDVGDVGSFVYDLECVLIKEQGRGLEVLMGIGEGGDCCFCSPMIATQCAKGTQPLIIEIYDGFFQTLNRTFICREHWKHMVEGEMNLFTSVNGFPLGLA